MSKKEKRIPSDEIKEFKEKTKYINLESNISLTKIIVDDKLNEKNKLFNYYEKLAESVEWLLKKKLSGIKHYALEKNSKTIFKLLLKSDLYCDPLFLSEEIINKLIEDYPVIEYLNSQIKSVNKESIKQAKYDKSVFDYDAASTESFNVLNVVPKKKKVDGE